MHYKCFLYSVKLCDWHSEMNPEFFVVSSAAWFHAYFGNEITETNYFSTAQSSGLNCE
jgi:hypothetical protein